VSGLTKQKCVACESGTPSLGGPARQQLHAQLDPDWKLSEDHIERTFTFNNFRDAFGMATRVALLAEDEGHHPDLEVSWGKLSVFLKTHAAGGLTENDFIVAAKIDEMA